MSTKLLPTHGKSSLKRLIAFSCDGFVVVFGATNVARCFSNLGALGAGDAAGWWYGRWSTTTPSGRSTGRYLVDFLDLTVVLIVIVILIVASDEMFVVDVTSLAEWTIGLLIGYTDVEL